MALKLDPAARTALDRAKRAVPDGGELDLDILLRVLYHGSALKERFPGLAKRFPDLKELRDKTPAKVEVAEPLRPALRFVAHQQDGPLGPEEWFALLLRSVQDSPHAAEFGIDEELIRDVVTFVESLDTGSGPPAETSAWRQSSERRELLDALDSFGRCLTVGEPPQKDIVEMADELEALVRALVKRKQRSAIIIGEPGTGKSALVYELARRMVRGERPVPEQLRGHDIFELSPVFLRSGASYVGQYDERVGTLLKLLRAHPQVILFVDEVHSMLQSGVHERGPFTDANEAFKQAVNLGEIAMIGATTTGEYRHYIEPDQALSQRFSTVHVDPPSAEATRRIMAARRQRVAEFYGLRIPDRILHQAVDLTEQYLPGRAQPRKTIQLLDEACAYCVTKDPPLEEVTEDTLWTALEETIGHGVIRRDTLDTEDVYCRLRAKIVGQDETLRSIATEVVSGLGGWLEKREAPRGIFFFCGPTGVGKTETALLLSRILGGGRESLVRVDCNTLQGSGLDSGPARNVLLGPPPGYIGYVRGQGGVLSKIRDHPESVLLFDEIEKADPGVGEILLRIIDDGRCEDNDGNILDFRRAFIIFTTNAGSVYDTKRIGFGGEADSDTRAHTDIEALRNEIRRMGLGEEFLGRIGHFFVFEGLSDDAVNEIIDLQLARLRETAEVRGFSLAWDDDIVPYLTDQWEPRFGVRHLVSILRTRVIAPVSIADAQGELKDVDTIRLEVLDGQSTEAGRTGEERHERRGSELVIQLA